MSINSTPAIHNLVMCANMFVKKDGKLLVLKRAMTKVYLPEFLQPLGGKIEIDEDPLDAAKRELLEEAGIEVSHIRMEAVITEVMIEKTGKYNTNWLVFYFSGDYIQDEVKETAEGELLWLSPQEIKEGKSLNAIKIIVEQIFSPEHHILFIRNTWIDEGKKLLEGKVTSIQ